MVLSSAWSPSKSVDAITIYSSTFQSRESTPSGRVFKVIVVSLALAVAPSSCQERLLGAPWISIYPPYTAMTLFPKVGIFGDQGAPCIVIVRSPMYGSSSVPISMYPLWLRIT